MTDTQKNDLFFISEQEKIELQATAEILLNIQKQKNITEDTLTKLSNAVIVLNALRDNYYFRFLRAAKQNRMLN